MKDMKEMRKSSVNEASYYYRTVAVRRMGAGEFNEHYCCMSMGECQKVQQAGRSTERH